MTLLAITIVSENCSNIFKLNITQTENEKLKRVTTHKL